MFQNLEEDTIEIKNKKEKNKKKIINEKNKEIFKNIIDKKYIIIYIVTFMISMVGFGEGYSVFSLAMLGTCISQQIPLLIIVIVSMLGNLIKFGINGLGTYFFTTLIMILSIFIFRPYKNEKERNEKIKLGKNIFLGTFIYQIIKLSITGLTSVEVIKAIASSILALSFYKIFVNSIGVLKDFKTKKAFSVEEVIGAGLLFAISFVCIGNLNIYGISILNIISILIVMILGWKHGILIGTTSGIIISMTLGAITGNNPIIILIYILSGILSGIIRKIGKIGLGIITLISIIILIYVSQKTNEDITNYIEMVIASIGLFAIPNGITLTIKDFLGESAFLPSSLDGTLNNNKNEEYEEEIKNAKTQEEIEKLKKMIEKRKQSQKNKEIFIGELLNTLEPYKENILYEDIADTKGKIIENIFYYLMDNDEMTISSLVQIFQENNSYIIGLNEKEINKTLQENLSQMVKIINMSYRVTKSEFIWRKKAESMQKIKDSNEENHKKIKNVSKAIQGMAKNIEKDIDIEDEYSKQTKEIKEKLKELNIEIKEISVKKEIRYIIEIDLVKIQETEILENIANILSEIFYEKIILNEDISTGRKLVYISDDKYNMTSGKLSRIRHGEEVSGDNILSTRLKDGKYLIALSDGMGTGKEASKSSKQALRLLENLLLSGFDKNTSLELINSTLIQENEDGFATLDIAIIDLYKGNIEFIKSGACPTYIKNNKKVHLIKSKSLPAGVENQNEIQSFDKDIKENDIILMVSDGILEANIEYKNKELWIKYLLEDEESNDTRKIAKEVMKEAVDSNYGNVKDDMTIIIIKIEKKK